MKIVKLCSSCEEELVCALYGAQCPFLPAEEIDLYEGQRKKYFRPGKGREIWPSYKAVVPSYHGLRRVCRHPKEAK